MIVHRLDRPQLIYPSPTLMNKVRITSACRALVDIHLPLLRVNARARSRRVAWRACVRVCKTLLHRLPERLVCSSFAAVADATSRCTTSSPASGVVAVPGFAHSNGCVETVSPFKAGRVVSLRTFGQAAPPPEHSSLTLSWSLAHGRCVPRCSSMSSEKQMPPGIGRA